MTSPDNEDLLDFTNRKAKMTSLKAIGGIKLQILEEFNRRQTDLELNLKHEKVTRSFLKNQATSCKERIEHNTKVRDDKIKSIKVFM